MHYIYQSPHKDKTPRICVCVYLYMCVLNFLLILRVIFKAVWHLVSINLSCVARQTCEMENIRLVTNNNNNNEDPQTFHEQISQHMLSWCVT